MANFINEIAPGTKQTWRHLCDRAPPSVGPNGQLIGPWGDAIRAAVMCEKMGQMHRFSDGPAGQVIDYLEHKGFHRFLKAANTTEDAAHKQPTMVAVSGGPKPSKPDTRPVCNYGKSCYRKNPAHFAEFAHPWLDDSPTHTTGSNPFTEGASGGYPSGYQQSPSPSAAVSGGYPSGYQQSPSPSAYQHNPFAATGGSAVPSVIPVKCVTCRSQTSMGIPSGTAPGTTLQASCQKCGAINQAMVPGAPQACAVQALYQPSVSHTAQTASVGGPPPKVSGRQRALLIGINYFGSRAELRGCINDVHNIHRLLTQDFGWNSHDIRTLTDDKPGATTRSSITSAMHWLVQGAQPGDVFFFHFSGHGAQQEDPYGYEEDGMNETILPADFQSAGQITDDEMCSIMVRPLPAGAKLTAVMDCCHSGTGLDLPFTWTDRGWREEVNPFYSLGDVQMFSGCEDDDTSSDASTSYGSAGGAMTTAFCDVLRQNPCPTYPELMMMLHTSLRRRGFSQRPQLTSSQQFEIHRPFILSDILPNMNPNVGRIYRQKFPPRPRPMKGPLADMLGIGVAMAGGMIGGMLLGDLAGDILGGGGGVFGGGGLFDW